MNHNELIERRKFERFPLKEGAQVAFTPVDEESHYSVFCQILDLSLGGLAFENEGGIDAESKSRFLDIFGLVEPHALLKGVPFRDVYDREAASHKGKTDNGKIHHHGIEFGELSGSQISQLNSLIENYALRK